MKTRASKFPTDHLLGLNFPPQRSSPTPDAAMSTLEERSLLLLEKLEAQETATEKLSRTLEQVKADAAESKKEVGQVKADAAESKKALEAKVEQQGQKIQQLEGEVKDLKETSSSSSPTTVARPSEDVQTGKFVRRWRIVFVVGALVPHAFVLASLKDGDMKLVAASKMFENFGFLCSVASAFGNPRNFGSRKEKLFIGLCSLSPAAYYAIQAYTLGLMGPLIVACGSALIQLPCFLGGAKLYSNLSDRKLGAAVTALFKSLPGFLIPMLYISAESLRCIMDSNVNTDPDDKVDEWGYIESCGNPSQPTWWVSAFLTISWFLTYYIPPMLPSDRTLTWDNVMNLDMGMIEGLQFLLFSTFSIEVRVCLGAKRQAEKARVLDIHVHARHFHM